MEGIYFNKVEKCLYINNVENLDLVNIAEYAKKANKENMNSENVCSTCTRLSSEIESSQKMGLK